MAGSDCAAEGDTLYSFASIFRVIPSLIWEFIPYGLLSAAFAGFVVWNGGIVLGESSIWAKYE
jgi:alpha-1,2-glucosyltransferase